MAKQSRIHRSRKTLKSRSSKRKKRNVSPETTAIVKVAAPTERPWILNNEQVVLLKNYLKIADASDVELKGCLEVSRRYKLDPFKQGQIWFVKRWDKNASAANGTKGAYVYVPQVGIYGMLHIAARDYKDFGSISEAEFGPMFSHDVEGHKIKAPEWCRVKAYKKGVEQPTVATIYFEEFCPGAWDNARLFWAKMPRAQLEKCCKARVVRTAYPDLGGLFIPEEMDRMNEEVTAGGRRIVEGSGMQHGSHEAAQRVLQEKLAAHAEGKPIEPEIVDPEPPAKQPAPSKKASGKIPESEYHPENVPPPVKAEPWKYAGTVTFDYSQDKTFPRITGGIAELIPHFPKDLTLKRKDDFWHAFAEDADRIKQVAVEKNFKIEEILPQKPSGVPPKQRHDAPEHPGPKGRGTGASGSPGPVLMKGVIEQANPESGKSPRVSVLFKVDKVKYWCSAFDTALFPPLIAGKGKAAELFIKESSKGEKTYKNIIGLKKVGAVEYDDDGKTPVIQRKDQEAGGRTLFGT